MRARIVCCSSRRWDWRKEGRMAPLKGNKAFRSTALLLLVAPTAPVGSSSRRLQSLGIRYLKIILGIFKALGVTRPLIVQVQTFRAVITAMETYSIVHFLSVGWDLAGSCS